jgi:hypothetical protein
MSETVTTQNVFQSNIPPFLEPYYKQLLEDSRVAFRPGAYTPYSDAAGNPLARLEGFSPLQKEAFEEAGNLMSRYQPMFDAAGAGANDLMGMGAGINAGDYYSPTDFENTPFTQDQINAWMDPYITNVLDRAKDRATNRFNEQQVVRDREAALTNSFGGSRRFVTNAIAQRDLNDNLADLDATQMSAAFNNALQGLTGQRQLGEASRQFDTGTRLKAADVIGAGANLNLNLGTQQGRADLSSIDAMLKTGGMQQQLGQAGLDLAYQDFLNQRDWSRNMLTQHNAIMRGIPMTNAGGTQVQSSQPGNVPMGNQIAGAITASYPMWRGLFN